MNFVAVIYACSWVTVLIGLSIAASMGVGLFFGDTWVQAIPLAQSAIVPMIVGSLLALFTYKKKRKYSIREGFGTVAGSWLAAAIFGALPYVLAADFFWYDAIFEAISGFTTTGASIIDNTTRLSSGGHLSLGLDNLSKGLLFWRCSTHFLGGMGFVVLSVAILPFLGLGTQHLFSAESSAGKSSNQLASRIASASQILWGVYLVLTIILTILLKTAGMDWFDSICHSFSTMATGGFSTKQTSIAFFDSTVINSILTIFMLIAATNFILHARAIRGQLFTYLKDEEFRGFITMVAVIAGIGIASIYITQKPFLLVTGETLEPTLANCADQVLFTVASIVSTTGYVTCDYAVWPRLMIFLIILLLLVGGCAGSTSGGLKQVRLILVIKHTINQVKQCLFPHAKPNIRFSAHHVDIAIVNKALGFFTFFICFSSLISFILMALALLEPQCAELMTPSTAATISLSCLSNVGPGLGNISPLYTFSWLTPSIKLLLALVMVIGRLEVFTILVLFLPSFWRK